MTVTNGMVSAPFTGCLVFSARHPIVTLVTEQNWTISNNLLTKNIFTRIHDRELQLRKYSAQTERLTKRSEYVKKLSLVSACYKVPSLQQCGKLLRQSPLSNTFHFTPDSSTSTLAFLDLLQDHLPRAPEKKRKARTMSNWIPRSWVPIMG